MRKQLVQLEKSQAETVQQTVRLNEAETQLALLTAEKTEWKKQHQLVSESWETEKKKVQTLELKLAKQETELAVKNELFERLSTAKEVQDQRN